MEKVTLQSRNVTYINEYENDIMSLEWWQKNVIYHVYLPSFKDSNSDGVGDFQDMNVIVDLVANHTSDQHPWFQKSIMKEEPYSDFYVWVDKRPTSTEVLPPNNWLSIFGGSAWTWNEHRQQFYLHQFLPEQPDLNYRNPIVKEEIKKVMSFWLEKGVDGFRIDAASHLLEDEQLRDEPIAKQSKAKKNEHGYLDHIYTKGLEETFGILKEFRVVLDEFESKSGKAKIMVTEVFEEIKDVMKYYGEVGNKIADFPFNFQLYKVKATSTGRDLFRIIDSWFSNMPRGKYPNWVVSSHDDPRIISRVGRRLASSLQMVMLLLPGIPINYYGDEIGMENAKIKTEDIKDSFALRTSVENSRDPMRTPMQWNGDKNAGFTDSDTSWLPVNENYKNINVEVEKDDPMSFLSLFKYLMKLRKEPSVLVGLLEFPVINENIFSFIRFLVDTKCYLIVLNMSNLPICVNLSNSSHLLPNEGLLEVSNGHIQALENEEGAENPSKIFQCKCDKELPPNRTFSGCLRTQSHSFFEQYSFAT